MLKTVTSPNWQLLAILLLAISLAVGRLDSFQIGAFQDDAHYIVTAKSLATGLGYRLINYPSKPPETVFPPGYPLLLTPIEFIFDDNFLLIRLFSLLMMLASLVLAYRLFAARVSRSVAIAATELLALNPAIIGASVMAMSEAPYLFFSLLALNLFAEWLGKPRPFNRMLPLVVFTTGFAIVIRTIGIALPISFAVFLIGRRKWSHLGWLFGLYALAVSPLVLFNLRLGGLPVSPVYGQYFLGQVGGVSKVEQVWMNSSALLGGQLLGSIIPVTGQTFMNLLGRWGISLLWPAFNLVVLVVLGIGVLETFSRNWFVEVYLLVYSLGLLPYANPDPKISAIPRYLIAITPFLILFFVNGIRRVARACSSQEPLTRAKRISVFAILGFLVLLYLVRNLQDIQYPVRDRTTDLSVGATWISQNTPPDSIVMCSEPVSRYLYTRRLTVGFPTQIDRATFVDEVQSQGVNYIIVGPPLETPRSYQLDSYILDYVVPGLVDNPRVSRVFRDEINNVTVFRLTNH